MTEARSQHKSEIRIALVSLLLGAALLGIKFLAYFMTGSSAIFSDAVESIANVLAAGFALYSVFLASKPADAEHPYGHGKVEFLSAGFEGGLVLAASLVIVVEAINSLVFHPHPLGHLAIGAGCMVVAILVNGGLSLALMHRGRKNGSLTLVADGKHLLSDAITSIMALFAIAIFYVTGWVFIDPILALLIAVFVARIGISLLKDSASGLMDKQDESDEALLKQLLDSHLGPEGNQPRICSYHKLKHRHSGRYHWVDFHIRLPADWNVRAAHDAASALEYEIENALPPGNATAHVEPCQDTNCPARQGR